jgi:hypothetical protein
VLAVPASTSLSDSVVYLPIVLHALHVSIQSWLTWMAISSGLGIVMTYSTVLCNSYNSPLATAVTGNVKDLVSTLIGAHLLV